jgi:signal transduction histidine kinase
VVIALAAHVSWRIGHLQQALKQGVVSLKTYNQACYHPPLLPINDEIQQLNDDIAQLFKQISDYQRYLASLPSTLNHELHNPLNRLNLALARLPLDAAQKQPFEQAIAQITDITQRLTEAQNLKESIANTQLQRTNLISRLNDYFLQVIDYIGQDRVIYQPFQTQTAWVMADSFLIEQLLDKLVDNAIAFNADPAPIRISCNLNTLESITKLTISISNEGPVWPANADPRAEFFSFRKSYAGRTNTTSSHLGLGLHLSDLIAKRHNGHLLLTDFIPESSSQSVAPIGATVTLVLPCLT